MNLFDFDKPPLPKNNKPISIIELFGGIGSQLKALKRLNVEIENHYLVEVDINATISYAAIHFDLDKHLNESPPNEEMIEYLKSFNWWSNEKPYDIKKLNQEKLVKLYHAQKLTNNLGDVFKLKTLPKVDLITWSTPCQDFSLAGKRAGFDGAKGGLTFVTLKLFEQLKEEHKLPKYLLFENVAAITDQTNIKGFQLMLEELEKIGFENKVLRMNAKNYGIPQNRDRVFVLSIRNDVIENYQWGKPKEKELKVLLKDLLEDNVDEKYYLSDKMLNFFFDNTDKQKQNGNGFRFNPVNENEYKIAKSITTKEGSRMDDNFIKIPEKTKQGYKKAYHGDGVYLDRPHQKRGTVQSGMTPTIKTSGEDIGVVEKTRIRKLTPKECWKLMGFDDIDVDKASKHMSNSALYKQAGNSIVVNVLEEIFKTILGD